jgi:hypothetical protein
MSKCKSGHLAKQPCMSMSGVWQVFARHKAGSKWLDTLGVYIKPSTAGYSHTW